jgi:hypothetical protein
MKTIKLFPILVLLILTSCGSVSVYTDYDKNTTFDNYKTYAFLKSSVDKIEISDLDKKRILRSIDEAMTLKGFHKTENPDLLISIFTKEQERVDVFNNAGFGWGLGWGGPFWGMNYNSVSTSIEGVLFIDFIDTKNKELVWQGEGTGYLTKDPTKKDERIKMFVDKILEKYPPQKK